MLCRVDSERRLTSGIQAKVSREQATNVNAEGCYLGPDALIYCASGELRINLLKKIQDVLKHVAGDCAEKRLLLHGLLVHEHNTADSPLLARAEPVEVIR